MQHAFPVLEVIIIITITLIIAFTYLPHEPQSSWSQSGGSHDSTIRASVRQLRKSKKKLPGRAIEALLFILLRLSVQVLVYVCKITRVGLI